ncbi:MAG TPA: hypothetical protein QF626_11180 [Prochlorococcaceae cyanobacterium Fu_MAG_50]|nr:hypothetical protein [Prochlorococcaceae cyanobacterium Fu_MAG_50]
MGRPSPLLWLIIALVILLPTAAGRALVDLLGGLMLLALAIPVVLTGVGWIGWKVLQSRMITCESCGARSLAKSGQCPVCGSGFPEANDQNRESSSAESSVPASSVIIDISAEDAGSES